MRLLWPPVVPVGMLLTSCPTPLRRAYHPAGHVAWLVLQLGCCDFKPAFNNPIPNLINTNPNLKVRTRRCSAG